MLLPDTAFVAEQVVHEDVCPMSVAGVVPAAPGEDRTNEARADFETASDSAVPDEFECHAAAGRRATDAERA